MPELQNVYTIRLSEKFMDGVIKGINTLMQKERDDEPMEYPDFDHLAVLRDILRAAEPEMKF